MMKNLVNILLLLLLSFLLLRSNLFNGLNQDLLLSYTNSQIFIVFLSCFVAQYLMYFRWLRFLRKLGVETKSDLIFMWHHRSVLIGYFIFGFVTSDMLRVYDARSQKEQGDLGARLLLSSQATILDRIFSLASLVVVASLALPVVWLVVGSTYAAVILFGGIIFSLMCVYFGIHFFKIRERNIYILNLIKLVKDHVNKQDNFRFVVSQFSISLSANLIMGFAFYVIAKAEFSLMPFSISVLSLSNLTAVIPLTPAGLGFAEGLSEYLMTGKGLLLGAEAVFILRIVNLLVTLTYYFISIFSEEKTI